MKKIIMALAIAGSGFFLMTSCSKTSQDAINLASNQQASYPQYSMNCQFLPSAEYAKIPEAKLVNVDLSKTIVNLKVPPIGNQGSTGSPIGWGTNYAARSIDWQANHPAAWDPSVNIFSPYYPEKLTGCNNLIYVTTALDLLRTQGACVSSLVTNPDCAVPPTLAQIANASLHRISSYARVSRTTTAIKGMLNSGKPVIVAGPVNNAFLYYTSGVLGAFVGPSLGGHCYCIVGYDDTKSAFKIMNSWGTSWGISGFGYIAYGYESAWWQEAYVIY